MGAQQPNISGPQARAYILAQGQSIKALNTIISSHVFVHHIGRLWSMLLELVLYLAFLTGLICLCGIAGNEGQIFGLISLPSPFIAYLLRRNRLRNQLIHQASIEVKKMKKVFDDAVRDWGL